MKYRSAKKMLMAAFAVALALCTTAHQAIAQAYPNKTITIVVPFPPAGGTNATGRMIATLLEKRLKQSVIVENRPGAGGYLGSELVTRAAPDGYTLLMSAGPILHSKLFLKSQTVDLTRELTPIAPLGQAPFVITVTASLGVKTLKDFIALAKANPKKFNAAYVPASTSFLDTVTFKSLTGTDLVDIPYNSSSDSLLGLARGDSHLYLPQLQSVKSLLDAGKVVALAVGGSERYAFTPELPTLKELGYDMTSVAWFGLFGPPKLSQEMVNFLYKETSEVMATPEAQDMQKKIFLAPMRATPEQMRTIIAAEAKQYAAAAKAVGLEPQ